MCTKQQCIEPATWFDLAKSYLMLLDLPGSKTEAGSLTEAKVSRIWEGGSEQYHNSKTTKPSTHITHSESLPEYGHPFKTIMHTGLRTAC